MSKQDSISLNGMRFHTCVGLLPHEQHIPQPLELDLRVWVSLRRVGQTDSPDELLDYRDLYRVVRDAVHESHHKFLEGLCERIAARAFEFHGVERARVAARKPHAPLDGPIDYVEVVVDRLRDE